MRRRDRQLRGSSRPAHHRGGEMSSVGEPFGQPDSDMQYGQERSVVPRRMGEAVCVPRDGTTFPPAPKAQNLIISGVGTEDQVQLWTGTERQGARETLDLQGVWRFRCANSSLLSGYVDSDRRNAKSRESLGTKSRQLRCGNPLVQAIFSEVMGTLPVMPCARGIRLLPFSLGRGIGHCQSAALQTELATCQGCERPEIT
jgi:hypothetical protein